jgi:hypothetical protein
LHFHLLGSNLVEDWDTNITEIIKILHSHTKDIVNLRIVTGHTNDTVEDHKEIVKNLTNLLNEQGSFIDNITKILAEDDKIIKNLTILLKKQGSHMKKTNNILKEDQKKMKNLNNLLNKQGSLIDKITKGSV